MKKTFTVEGMHCAACSASVERVVKRLSGVTRAEVNLLAKILIVEYDGQLSSAEVISAVERAGFSAKENKPAEKATVKSEAKPEKSKYPTAKTRLIVSFCFLIPLMYLSMGRMAGAPMPRFLSPSQYPVLYALAQMFLAFPVLFVNRQMFSGGVRAALSKSPNMDTLVATGSGAAFIFGVFAIFMLGTADKNGDTALVERYVNNLYFESSAMILALITIGKALEERAKRKTSSAVEGLKKLAPEYATVLQDGIEKKVAVGEISEGDYVLVRDGESVPVDGVISEGSAYLDEAALTGESVAVFKTSGDKAMSATVVKGGYIVLVATAVGGDTVLSKIINLVEEAGATKAPVAKLADKISGVFVPVVMCLALLTLIIWLCVGAKFEIALSNAVSVLVISCPCALGLATPVAVTASVGAGARRGILIKRAEVFELLAKTDTVIFDKTGTITEGKPAVKQTVFADGTDEEEALSAALSIEGKSAHPMADAVAEYCKNKVAEKEVSEFLSIAGKGVSGIIDGNKFYVGNKNFLGENSVDTDVLEDKANALYEGGNSIIWIAKNNNAIGIFAVADVIKENAKETVDGLRNIGVSTAILSGDNARACEAVKGEIVADRAYSEVLPDGKEQIVRGERDSGRVVAFVGDGINDSPALSSADVGIAVGGGASIAIDSADIVLMNGNIADVARCIDIGKKTVKNIKENLFWAFFYNVCCIPLAAGAFSTLGVTLNPMIAAAAMSVSSLFVVCNALRLTRNK